MRALIAWVALVAAAATAVGAAAEVHIYAPDPASSTGFRRLATAVDPDPGGGSVLVAQPYPTDFCLPCHGTGADQVRYAQDAETRHRRTYFPAAAIRLAESQSASIGTLRVTRTNNALVVHVPGGRRFQLPPDALVVRGRDSQPAFITYGGTNLPRALP